jgi:RTX calcium-binding nonapeptide repeat (4 copies)/Gametolysin peptidase M11
MRLLLRLRPWCFLCVLLAGGLLALPGTALAHSGPELSGPDVDYIETRAPLKRSLASTADPVRRVAVILFNFTDDRRRPYTAEEARHIVFTGEDSVNAFLRESSFGRAGLVGDVFGWHTIDESSSGCRFARWAQAAREAALEDYDDDGDSYQHYVFVFPHARGCSWDGMAELPGKTSWINGELTVRVVGHELGHNLGAQHASALRCWEDGMPVALSESCTHEEYGDPFDIMGGGARHTSTWNKARLGWLSPSNLATATASGTYTLTAQEELSADVQLLRIPWGETELFYYLELRQPFGTFFDNFGAADPAVNGISLRLAPDYRSADRSSLIDTNPETPGFEDAPLAIGRTFADPAHGVWIVNRGIVAGRATVEISLGAAPAWAPETAAPRPRQPRSRVRGTGRADVLTGARLFGLAGNDLLRGLAGRDVLHGGPGRDLLLGLRGRDTLHGGTGHDVLRGGPGRDTLLARDGARDTVRCGPGTDVVVADRGDRVGRDCELVKLR